MISDTTGISGELTTRIGIDGRGTAVVVAAGALTDLREMVTGVIGAAAAGPAAMPLTRAAAGRMNLVVVPDPDAARFGGAAGTSCCMSGEMRNRGDGVSGGVEPVIVTDGRR